jgi:hypothetical protein
MQGGELQEFAAASPYTDPVDQKKLLFVYRAGGLRPRSVFQPLICSSLKWAAE